MTLLILTAAIFSVYLYTENSRFWFKQVHSVVFIGDRMTGRIDVCSLGETPTRKVSAGTASKEIIERSILGLLVFLNIWAWRSALKKRDNNL